MKVNLNMYMFLNMNIFIFIIFLSFYKSCECEFELNDGLMELKNIFSIVLFLYIFLYTFF